MRGRSTYIGQRAFLIRTSEGNLLWDCVALLDDKTKAEIRRLGGISAIAISHPHYYTTMIERSRAFDNAPIYLHELNRRWVMRPEIRGQVFGARHSLVGAAAPLGAAFGGILLQYLSAPRVIAIFGILAGLGGLVSPSLRQLQRGSP